MNFRTLSRVIAALCAMAAMTLSTAVKAEWWKAETTHFIVYNEGNERDTEEYARQLERYDNALRLIQGMDPSADIGDANKVTVYRWGKIDDIAQMAGSTNSGVAGFYIPRASGAVSYVPAREPRRRLGRAIDPTDLDAWSVLKHEYVHHFMLQNFPTAYPGWYVEGFAEFYGTIRLMEDGKFHIGDAPQYRAAAVKQGGVYPLRKLFDDEYSSPTIVNYSTGWLLAHYLNFNEERRGQLPEYLKALNAGENSLDAARRIFGDLRQLERELGRYHRGDLPGFDVTPNNYQPPEVKLTRLNSAEESVMRAHMRSSRGVSKRDARDIAGDVSGPAEQNPGNFFVQLVAAEAFYDNKEYDRALVAADRALAVKPDSVEALTYKGMILMRMAQSMNADGVAQTAADGSLIVNGSLITQAREYFAKAIEADPRDGYPMIQYYESYRQVDPDNIPEDAVVILERAFPYSAFDSSYRILMANQLMSEDKMELARDVMSPLAFAGDRSIRRLVKIVEFIDEGKNDKAKERMARIMACGDALNRGEEDPEVCEPTKEEEDEDKDDD